MNRPLLGLSVSYTIEQYESTPNQYGTIMAQICDYLVLKYNACVLLIPNDISTKKYDDLDVALKILKMVEGKENIWLIPKECPVENLKGIISQCDILISARYHSIVAALSLGIPTVAISWHHKYPEIMSLLGQEYYLCPIENLSFNDLKEKTDKLWNNREKIHIEISDRVPSIKNSILSGSEKVKEIIYAYSN